MSAIPTWVFTAITITLIGTTAVVAVRSSGGVKHPLRLLVLTLVTVCYLFSLTFVQDVKPQLGLDLQGGVSVVLAAKGKNVTNSNLDQAVEIIRNRVDALGVAEPDISRQGNDIVVDLPGQKDARKAEKLIGQTAQLRFRQVAQDATTSTAIQKVLTNIYVNLQAEKKSNKDSSKSTTTTKPAKTETSSITMTCGGTSPTQVTLTGDLSKVTSRENDKADQPMIALNRDGKPVALCPAVLSGKIVSDAFSQVDSTTGEISVGVKLTSKGGTDFTNKIGRPLSNQEVAIVLDSVVQSAPQIQPSLADGLTNNQLQISVGTDKNQKKEVEELATVLRFGSLPVVLVQQTAQKVSPTLGTDQLHAGLIAGAIGLALVMLYMLLYYRVLALVVLAGVTLTGMTIYALVCWLGETQGLTLSLAGVVGLIVSLGVTVDSYVVYFEKLKDEVKLGRSLRSCLDGGFKSAFRTILAADLVSLIGAVALFYLASGSVRGFAFFLGMSTLLDLIMSYVFMHPMVKILAQNKTIVRNRAFGFAAALDKKDLEA